MRPIEDVERFGPELKLHSLGDGNVFAEREVRLPKAGATQKVAWGVAKCAGSGHGKCRGIELPARQIQRNAGNKVGALIVGIAVRHGRGRAIYGYVHRKPGMRDHQGA